MIELNWLDYTVIGLISLSVLISLFRGFIKETISIITWGLAIWLSLLFSDYAASALNTTIANEPLRHLVGFGAIFLSVLIIGAVFSFFISTLVKSTGFSGTDRLLGVAFGFARGVLISALILLVISLTSFQNQSWWRTSALLPQFKPVMVWLEGFIPYNLKHLEQDFTREKVLAEQTAIHLSENINPAATHLPS